MTIAINSIIGNPTSQDSASFLRVIGTFSLTSTYATGGQDLSTVFADERVKSTRAPVLLRVEDTSGYLFRYDRANNKLLIFQDEAVELGAGAYPSNLTVVGGDVVTFDALFPKA